MTAPWECALALALPPDAGLAALGRELVAIGDALGVVSADPAGLDEVGRLARRSDVVTIAAPWRGALLSAADFRVAPAILIAAIRDGDDPLCRDLAARLAAAPICGVLALPDPAAQRAELAELLNETVIRSRRALPGAADPVEDYRLAAGELSLRSRQRARLDRAFPGCLVPGNRIELADGSHAASAFAACFPPGWCGTLDLALCQSAYLDHEIAKLLPGARILTNTLGLAPEARLRIQAALYRRVERGADYADVLGELLAGPDGIGLSAAPLRGFWRRLRLGLRNRPEH